MLASAREGAPHDKNGFSFLCGGIFSGKAPKKYHRVAD